jgi:alkylation response protein AidB-like acyl-CoA dehydrogenase
MPSSPAVSELPRPHTPMNALTDDMLERFAKRAPQYDRENRFFTEDFEIVSAKYHAVENAWRVVDLALEVGGGFGIFRKSGLEQIFRDARLGRIHPANSMFTHELVAKTLLGINPDETPRWG